MLDSGGNWGEIIVEAVEDGKGGVRRFLAPDLVSLSTRGKLLGNVGPGGHWRLWRCVILREGGAERGTDSEILHSNHECSCIDWLCFE